MAVTSQITQSEAIQRLKNRNAQLRAENTDLVNENAEMREALAVIYEAAAGFNPIDQDDLDEMDFEEN